MAGSWKAEHSMVTRGAMPQFAAGVTLLFAIPLLVLIHVASSGMLSAPAQHLPWLIAIGILVALIVLSGFVLLRRGPAEIVRLRGELERVVSTDIAGDEVSSPLTMPSDVEAIHVCMRTIAKEFEKRVDALDGERAGAMQDMMLAHKVEGLGTMAAGVAHDYNNMLAAIMGNMSIVMHGLPDDSPFRENARQIEKTAARAVDLSSRIALYSGHCRMDLAPLNLSNVVREQHNALQAMVFDGITVELCLEAQMPLIHADRAKLERMLHCLVENASEAMTSRSGTIRITTGVIACDRQCMEQVVMREQLAEGRYAFIEVQDTGCGMSPEVRARMFDPFYTTKLRGQGLGLSVALGAARAHHGGVLVDSTPGQGTTIRVILPCPETLPESQ